MLRDAADESRSELEPEFTVGTHSLTVYVIGDSKKRQQCFTPTDSSVVGIRGRYLNGPCVLLRLRLTFDVWCQTGSVEGTFSKHEGLYLMQPVFFVQIRPPYCRNHRKRQEQPTVPGPTGHHSRGGKHELQCIFEAFSLSFQKQLSLIV